MDSAPAAAPVLRRRHMAAVVVGNALEFYDFVTYAFFAIQIGHAFFPASSAYGSLMLSLATFGAGFLTRPFGGFVIGAYADRAGRRPAMQLCLMLIGGSILALAVIPPYAVIGVAAPVLVVLARMVQGFSLGGEVGSNAAYLIEAAGPDRRGLAASWQGASQQLAALVGGLVGLLLTQLLDGAFLDAYGWRIAFLLGASAMPFGLWMRSNLPETLHTPDPAGAPSASGGSRFELARQHWRVLLLGLAVISGGTIVTYVRNYIVTYAQDTLHMPARTAFLAQTAVTLVTLPAAFVGGHLSDRYGRRPVNVSGAAALLLLVYPVFLWVATARSGVALVVGMTLLGMAFGAFGGSFYAALGESLPRAIRSTGFSTVYALATAVFGGTTQLVVTWLIHRTDDPLAPAWYMLSATAVMLVALSLLRESAPARLRAAAALASQAA